MLIIIQYLCHGEVKAFTTQQRDKEVVEDAEGRIANFVFEQYGFDAKYLSTMRVKTLEKVK